MLPVPLIEGTTCISSSGLLFKKGSLSEYVSFPHVVFLVHSMSCSMPEKFDILFRYLRPTTSVKRGCRRSEGDTFVPPLNFFFFLISAKYFSPHLWKMLKPLQPTYTMIHFLSIFPFSSLRLSSSMSLNNY